MTLCVIGLGASLLDIDKPFGDWQLLSLLIYYQVFYLNNVMYMLRIQAYREAYRSFLDKMKFWDNWRMTNVSLDRTKKQQDITIVAITPV